MKNTESKIRKNRTGVIKAAVFSLMLAFMMSAAVYPCLLAPGYYVSAESEKTAAASQEKAVPLKETGEPVKCVTGTLIAPVGDPEAKAPNISAEGAALYSLDMDRIVYAKNENKKLEPYSTTKLLTCWLALEKLDPDKTITVSAKAAQVYENGTTIWLKEGEKISVRDLIYGALLESGNDAAYALGEAVSGSEANFARLMNDTVAEWGCNDTHFVNANGWKNKEHYSTAHDMAVITAKCLENEDLANIAMTRTYTVPETNLTEAREMKNYFLHTAGKLDSLTGGKTGTWDDDDCAIVASFSEGGLSEVVVLLGATKKGRPQDLRKLIEFSHQVTPGFAIPAADTAVETVWVRHGEKTRLDLIADGTTYAYPAENMADEISTVVEHNKLEAPVKKGDTVGKLIVYSEDNQIGEHKLVASEDIAVGWFPSYLYISNSMTLNILKALGVILVLVILLIILNRRYRARKNTKKRPRSSASRDRGDSAEKPQTGEKASRSMSAKEKREMRKRLRKKYRNKH